MQAGLKPDQVHVADRFRDYSRVSDEADRKEAVFRFCPLYEAGDHATGADRGRELLEATSRANRKLSGEFGRGGERYSMPSRKATTRCSTSVVASAS